MISQVRMQSLLKTIVCSSRHETGRKKRTTKVAKSGNFSWIPCLVRCFSSPCLPWLLGSLDERVVYASSPSSSNGWVLIHLQLFLFFFSTLLICFALILVDFATLFFLWFSLFLYLRYLLLHEASEGRIWRRVKRKSLNLKHVSICSFLSFLSPEASFLILN